MRQARRQPSASCSGVRSSSSALVTGDSLALGTRTMHFPQVPLPPHSDRTVTPARRAASDIVSGSSHTNRIPLGSNSTVYVTAPQLNKVPSRDKAHGFQTSIIPEAFTILFLLSTCI